MPTTVTAIYHDGVLKPARPLRLRRNERVTLAIFRQAGPAGTEDLGPLAGAFPALAALQARDLVAAKRIWRRLGNRRAERPSRPRGQR